MSENPSKSPSNHPWDKYYQEREKSRPAMTRLPRPLPGAGGSRPPHSRAAGAGTKPPHAVYAELTATEVDLAPRPTNPAPAFLSPQQREELNSRARRRARWSLLRTAVIALAALVTLHFIAGYTLLREPSASSLDQVARALAPEILRLYSSADQPLEIFDVQAKIQAHPQTDEVSCVAEVTLRLREPLFAPAESNGTDLYRSHAAAIALAEAEAARRGLYTHGNAPVPPLLPKVLRTAHRTGETLTVEIPFNAQRFGWSWRYSPAAIERRSVSRTFAGAALAQHGSGPVLLLDSPGAQAGIRELTRAAKDYLEKIGRDLATAPGSDSARVP